MALDSDMFYKPVEIRPSPGLEAVADQAVRLLLGDGFRADEAANRVGLHIQAAAAFATSAESQDDLLLKVEKAPVQPSANYSPRREMIRADEALTIGPFLEHVAPYPIDAAGWLVDTVERVTESSDLTHPVLRWLELWDQKLPQPALGRILSQCVEQDEDLSGDRLPPYSAKLQQVFKNDPELVGQLMSHIGIEQTLPLFGELGPDSPYVKEVAGLIKDKEIAHVAGVHAVRHVNYYADDCPATDGGHLATVLDVVRDEEMIGRHGDAVLLSVRGVLLGSIKMTGHRSMLALRSVRDEQGKLPLVVGGVYVPRQELAAQAEAAFEEQGKWAHLELDELAVRPLRFLDVREAKDITSLAQTAATLRRTRKKLARQL